VDGFSVGNAVAHASGRVYNTLAVHLPFIWEIIYDFTDRIHDSINKLTADCVGSGILKVIEQTAPDIIVSVHATFVGSILNILEKAGLHIPVISVVADLDNITSLWADRRVHSVLCPSDEAKRKVLKSGVPPERVFVFGFPVRDAFTDNSRTATFHLFGASEGQPAARLPIALLISGSQGSKRIKKIVDILLAHNSCRLCVVTGTNEFLRKRMEARYAQDLGIRLEVIGFTPELDKYMRLSDFLIARASPNVLMEAVALHKPIIITDSFNGQEKKNPAYMEHHGLGVFCKTVEALPKAIEDLTADNGAQLKAITERQIAYDKGSSAKRIAKYILSVAAGAKNDK
jgi:processive 1,2-diacylglycerol beta-glucosyltransferase